MKTIAKALRVLKHFTPEREEWGVSDLARATGINKVIVHRILRAFAEERFVVQDEKTRRYRLGDGLIALARSNLQHVDIATLARPALEQLRDRTDETVMLVVRRGLAAIVAQPFESRQTVRVTAQVGDWASLHSSATGKLFLAYGQAGLIEELLENRLKRFTRNTITTAAALRKAVAQARHRGWAVDDEEFVDGIRAVAAPVLMSDESLVACVAVRAPATRLPRARLAEVAAQVVEVAARLSAELRARNKMDAHHVP